MKMPKIWEIVKKFKDSCRFRGWRTSEGEDWVEVDDKYHNFVYAREVHPSSFKRIVSNTKCVVREGLYYRIVDASYTAWLLSEPPSESLIKTIFENPDYSKSVALYDLSPALEGKNVCIKINHTDSPVFQEFEAFLKSELKLKLKPLSTPELDAENYSIASVA
ncbi:MAG: hypothetical protein QXH37_05435 [Candidatus Bathyarchaeia archaeon]